MTNKEQQTLEKQTRKVRTPLIRSFTNCSETTPIEIFLIISRISIKKFCHSKCYKSAC